MACVLILLIGTLVIQVVVPMARGTVRGTQQVELQQVGALALNQLCADLQSSSVAGIVAFPENGAEPALVSIHPLRTIDTSADQVWADELVLYWWSSSEQKLWRATWPHGGGTPPPPTDEPTRPTRAELLNVVRLPHDRFRRAIATQVQQFEVDPLASPCRVSLRLQAPAPDGKPPESFSLNRSLSLRNERS